ncbi:MAG: DsbA family protein [Opitutaceae bacterium]
MVNITYYLDVVSSWCFYSESTWALLKSRYGDVARFDWRIATIPESGLPRTREEEEWYYRRSGTMVGRVPMLHSGWWEPGISEYLAPNAVAEAARDHGCHDDSVRLALAAAAMEEGLQVGRWEVAASVAAPLLGMSAEELEATARSDAVVDRVRRSTRDFFDLQVTQRPAFVIRDEIDDRAVFSGLIQPQPLIAAIDQMIADCRAYRSWTAHFGQPG